MEATRPASPLQLEFDQYHRHAALALLLKPLLAALARPARLLDIHGAALNLLTDFLAPLPIEATAAHLTPERGHGTILLPKDKPIPLPDQSVDFTIALEALEQVPAEDRTYCVSEWLRVAKEGIIISCPLLRRKRRGVKVPEKKVASRRHAARTKDSLQPPSAGEVRGILDKLGLVHVALAPVPPAEWLPLLVLLEENHPLGSAKLAGVLQHLLKMRLFRTYTHQRPYRRLFLAWKSAEQARAAQVCWFPQQLPSTAPSRHGPGNDESVTLHPVMMLASRLSSSFATPIVEPAVIKSVEVATAVPVEKWERQARETQAALEKQERDQAWREWRLLETADGVTPEKHDRPAPGMADAEPHGFCRVPSDAHLWEATATNAHFRWKTNLPAGWLRLQLSGRGPHGELVRVLLKDGTHETPVLLGRWPGEDTFSRYVHCGHSVTEVRVCPRATPGPVRIDKWEATPSTKRKTCLAGLGRLLADGWTVAGAWQTLRLMGQAWWQGGWRGVGRLCLGRAMQPWRPADADQEPLSYADWIKHEECIDQERDQALGRLCKLPGLPSLAVLLAVPPDTTDTALERTLGSLAEQGYPRAEFLVAVTRQDVPRVRALLSAHPALTVTTRLIVLEQLLHHIPIVLNELIGHARSDHFALVAAGDQLGREALLFMADALGRNPVADFLYADEDRWSFEHGRHNPTFKPGWSPDSFLARPYTGNLVVFRTAAVRRAGGFSDRWPHGHDIDMICRLAHADGRNVVHVPKVLYHAETSFPRSAVGARKEAIAHHLRQGLWGMRSEPSVEEVRPVCKGAPKVSIIIPSAGKEVTLQGKRTTYLTQCLETLRQRTTYPHYEIVVVTNGPLGEQAEEAIRRNNARRAVVPPPFHFSASINAGAKQATGDYLLLLNDDSAVITPDWLERMLAYATQPGVGVVGAKLLFPDGSIQHMGVALTARGPGHPFYGQKECPGGDVARNCMAVTGACLLTSRQVFDEVAGFADEFPMNYNDVDYCLKVRQTGKRVVLVPQAELYHDERQRRDGHAAVTTEELERFRRKWAATCAHDPYFNANLCPWAGDGRLSRHSSRS